MTEFCYDCGAGIGKFRRIGEGTCSSCDPQGIQQAKAERERKQYPTLCPKNEKPLPKV